MSDVFKGVRLKLYRVEEHIQEIQSCVDTYSAKYPHTLFVDANRETTFNVTATEAIDVSVLIGECVYQMRSVLDHLAFALVQKNPSINSISPGWEGNCQFPTWLTDSGKTPPLPYNVFEHTMPGISKPAFAFIESIQPYYGIGTTNNSLGLLNNLAKIDRHRHLATTRHRGQIHESRRYRSGISGTSTMAVDHGAKIGMAHDIFADDPPVEVSWMVAHYVSFNEPILKDACSPAVQYILQTILDEINGIIIPAFEKLINQP